MKIQLAIYSAFIFSFSSLALIVPEAGGQKPGSAPERSLSSEQDADPEQEKDNESATEPAPENAAPLQQKKLASAVAKAITIRTNKFRKENGLDKLKSDADLKAAAQDFAAYMAKTDRYGHYADGRTPAQRAKAAGYKYCVVRENIAYKTNPGDPSEEGLIETFVQGWIDSPEHRENMLAPYITETGSAVATTDGVTFFAVQMFGRPKSKAIQIEIAQRGEKAVTLVIESNNSRDEMVLEPRMRLRMTRCFPTELSIESSDTVLNIDSSTRVAIENGQLNREAETSVNSPSSD